MPSNRLDARHAFLLAVSCQTKPTVGQEASVDTLNGGREPILWTGAIWTLFWSNSDLVNNRLFVIAIFFVTFLVESAPVFERDFDDNDPSIAHQYAKHQR